MSTETNFIQRVTINISFTTTVGTVSEEPEEGRDIIVATIEPMLQEIREQYEDVEVSAESEVIDG